jgi:hypothetical protein
MYVAYCGLPGGLSGVRSPDQLRMRKLQGEGMRLMASMVPSPSWTRVHRNSANSVLFTQFCPYVSGAPPTPAVTPSTCAALESSSVVQPSARRAWTATLSSSFEYSWRLGSTRSGLERACSSLGFTMVAQCARAFALVSAASKLKPAG